MKIVFTDGNDSKFVSLCHELDEYLSDIVGSEKQKKQYSKYNTLEDIQNVALAIEND